MKRLGVILHTIHNGNLIVRSATGLTNTALNTAVWNEQVKKIGKIVDIFGPLSRPYFSIKPSKKSDFKTHKLKDKNLYVK